MRITEPRTRRGALTALSTLGETYREGAATPAPLEQELGWDFGRVGFFFGFGAGGKSRMQVCVFESQSETVKEKRERGSKCLINSL